MSNITLGLDIGPNSIGWALVDEEQHQIIDLGVRVFPEGVDNFDTKKEKSRNEDRRIARGMRRQIARRRRRKRKLRDALIAVGLFPQDATEQEALYQQDPYELRAKALNEMLTPHQVGRVLLHLNQRRGFKSNKKEEAKAEAKAKRKKKTESSGKTNVDAEKKKPEDILLEMDELDQAIKRSDARTLGEYLYRKSRSLDHQSRKEEDHIRGRHTKRQMLVEEFDAIWAEQSKHHPNVLSDELAYGKLGRQRDISRPIPKWAERRKELGNLASVDLQAPPDPEDFERQVLPDLNAFGLFGLIFFHRTLKPVPKEIVGLCELESREEQKERLRRSLGVESDEELPPIDIRRCHRADRHAQRFRLLQEVNNLRLIDGREERPLNKQERVLVLDRLSQKSEWTFDAMRTELANLPGMPPAKHIQFNLERGKRTKMQGMQTDYEIAKAVGKDWHERAEDDKDAIVRALIYSVDDDETHEKLMAEFGLTTKQADAALSVDLTGGPTKGYVNLCLHAIDELIPFLEQSMRLMGNDETDSALHAAGYLRRDELQRRLFDRLPDPARMNPRDCPIGDIPNPVVKRALVELRKVVNAIIREYGKPSAVHVEMGRDVKTRPKDKKSPAYRRYMEQQGARAEQERKRTAAKEKLRENGFGYGAGGRNIVKYLLWQEQAGHCIYSGKPISFTQIMSEEVELDHILPRSQSLDDSQINKVVCFRSENHPATGKGQRTSREWLEVSNPTKYDEVCQRAKKLPYAKYRRFLQQKVELEGCIARQLNDTRYIARATVEYLRLLVEHDHDVVGLKGQLTSTLRRLWGLDTVLSEMPDSPAWQEQAKIRPGEKNRADHRHHAIDALVVAMTDRRRLQQLSRGFSVEERIDPESGEIDFKTVYRGEHIEKPFDNFREAVIAHIKHLDANDHGQKYRRGVSHRAERKVGGELHEDTFYGPTPEPGVFVVRKPLENLSPNEVPLIRDEAIRRVVEQRLADHGIEIGRGKKVDAKKWKQALCDTGNPVLLPPSKKRLRRDPKAQGIPIKKVRVYRKELTIQPIRKNQPDEAYVKPGSTHHLCIFEWEENGRRKRDAVFVTQLEAINRVKRQKHELGRLRKQWKNDGLSSKKIRLREREAMRDIAKKFPIIQRDASDLEGDARNRIPSHATFIFSLSRNDLLLLEINRVDTLYVYDTAASTTRQMTFYPHTAAKHQGLQHGKLTKYPGSLVELNPRKVTVDPIGRIRWAND